MNTYLGIHRCLLRERLAVGILLDLLELQGPVTYRAGDGALVPFLRAELRLYVLSEADETGVRETPAGTGVGRPRVKVRVLWFDADPALPHRVVLFCISNRQACFLAGWRRCWCCCWF